MASIEELDAIHHKFKELERYVLWLVERAERGNLPLIPAVLARSVTQPDPGERPDVRQPIPGVAVSDPPVPPVQTGTSQQDTP